MPAIVLHQDGTDVTTRDLARFNTKVARGEPDACWRWLGRPNHAGYGRLHIGGRSGRYVLAHRLSLALASGVPIPPNVEACHSCDNPICVNPAHLFRGTHTENMADRDRKGRVASAERHGSATKPESRVKGEQHGRCLLTEPIVLEVRAAYSAGGVSYGELAKKYQVSSGTIRDIVKRRRWKHI